MYSNDQNSVTTIILSAIVRLHQKMAKVIDQVFFEDISQSDPLVNKIHWSEIFDLQQDLEIAVEEDIRQDHRGNFGTKETHWWLDFALPGGKRLLFSRKWLRARTNGKSTISHMIPNY